MFEIFSRRKLIGRSVRVTVGEPWDFSSSSGPGTLVGRIVGISGFARSAIIEIEVEGLRIGQQTLDRLFMKARYEKVTPGREFLRGIAVTGNFFASRAVSTPCIIGDIQLLKK